MTKFHFGFFAFFCILLLWEGKHFSLLNFEKHNILLYPKMSLYDWLKYSILLLCYDFLPLFTKLQAIQFWHFLNYKFDTYL